MFEKESPVVHLSRIRNRAMSGFRKQPSGFSTKAIHAGQDPKQWEHMAVVPPLVTSTTFKKTDPTESSVSNQNVAQLTFLELFIHRFQSNLV